MSIPEPTGSQEFAAGEPRKSPPADIISLLEGRMFIIKYKLDDNRIVEVETATFHGNRSDLDLTAGWIVAREENGWVTVQRMLT